MCDGFPSEFVMILSFILCLLLFIFDVQAWMCEELAVCWVAQQLCDDLFLFYVLVFSFIFFFSSLDV